MRIGLVLPNVPAYSETFFVNKIKGLQSHGHEVLLFVNAKTDIRIFEGANVISLSFWSRNPIANLFQLLTLMVFHFKNIRQFYRLEQKDQVSFFSTLKGILTNGQLLSQKLDWLHFGFGTMALDRENVAAAIQAQMAVSFRGYDHYVYPLKNKDCYKKLFAKKVKYHVLSEGMKKTVSANNISDDQILKITPAIDRSLFVNHEQENSTAVLQIITVARLHWIKGLESTLEALAIIKQKGIHFQYTIVGDGPEKERLQFAAHQLGLSNEVVFAGKLNPLEVKKALENASIYLQYSFQEGFCNAVLEAQAMGKLCIVSDAEGLSENVVNGQTGFVVSKRNSISLAQQILTVLKLSETDKMRIAENAIKRIDAEFSLPNQMQKFLSFYNATI